MAGMMGGAQENLAGGETDQQTLFMIQGVRGARGGRGEQHHHGWALFLSMHYSVLGRMFTCHYILKLGHIVTDTVSSLES